MMWEEIVQLPQCALKQPWLPHYVYQPLLCLYVYIPSWWWIVICARTVVNINGFGHSFNVYMGNWVPRFVPSPRPLRGPVNINFLMAVSEVHRCIHTRTLFPTHYLRQFTIIGILPKIILGFFFKLKINVYTIICILL